MLRSEMIARLSESRPWDIIIIGGGATGAGCAVDAASRGYRTLLIEQGDYGQGTSSRSTKLAHGGVRYLRQGNMSLVLGALSERGLMRQNAPHLVHDLAFVVPNYDWWEAGFYGVGLRLYDIMAGKQGFGRSKNLSKEKTIEHLPTIETEGLRGGVIYYDGQFDDARMVINLIQTADDHGATVVNYMQATGLIHQDDVVRGVTARDVETGTEYQLEGRVVINATGAFSDSVRKMDNEKARNMINPSQGIHIVLDKSFLPGNSAIMVPETDDGRVLFAIPWHDSVMIGTTDTPINEITLEPKPMQEEIDFLLTHAARYLTKDPTPDDVLSVFVGIRPLVSGEDETKTSAISRDHTLSISDRGLVTIAGGKWTTYRKMAEDTIDQAAMLAELEPAQCITKELRLHGYHSRAHEFGDLSTYGAEAPNLLDLVRDDPSLGERLHPDRPWTAAEVVWAVREEMARRVEDFLSRRVRALLLGAKVSVEMAPKVAKIMAAELGHDDAWQNQQVEEYTSLANKYTLTT